MAIKKLKKTEVSYLIVNYNQEKDLASLIKDIRKNSTGLEYEILVFDNSGEIKQSTDFKLFTFDENIGYGPAINYLSTQAKGRNLLVLNPDVKIVKPLREAVSSYEKSGIKKGILGLGKDEKQYGIPLFSSFKKKKRFSGYAFIISKELFKVVGGFSSDYFMYFEDSDLCERLKTFKVYSDFTETSYIKHKKTYKNLKFRKRKLYYYESLLIFLKQHRKVAYYFYFVPLKLLVKVLSKESINET